MQEHRPDVGAHRDRAGVSDAHALEQEVDCLRIGVMIAGLEVPHAHIHLVPIKNISDLSFTNQRVTISEKEMAELASRVAAAFK